MEITTMDGHSIQSIHKECGSNQVVLLCHGITSEKTEGGTYSSFAKKILERGLDSIMFDFRGHGESSISSTDATITGMILDISAVIEACSARYDKLHIVSASFGSSVFLLAASNIGLREAKICSATLWNPVTDYASTFFRASVAWGHSFFPQGDLLSGLRECPVRFGDTPFSVGPAFVTELHAFKPNLAPLPTSLPQLLFHGQADSLVNFEDTQRYRDKHAPLAKLHLYPNVDHGLDAVQSDVQEKTLNFILNA